MSPWGSLRCSRTAPPKAAKSARIRAGDPDPLALAIAAEVAHADAAGRNVGLLAEVPGRFKIIARPGGRVALYDLANDPGEQRDVSAQRPLTLAFLRGLLGLRLAETQPGQSARPRPRHRPSNATIDPELEAQLEALGYVGSQRRQ